MSDSGFKFKPTYLVPWTTIFIVLKLYGPAAAWSWWWLLFSAYPDVVLILHRVGMF